MDSDAVSTHPLRFEAALAYTERLYQSQGLPVSALSSRLACAALVLDDQGSPEEALVAVLGPLPVLFPRSGKTLAEIEQIFGPAVSHLLLLASPLMLPEPNLLLLQSSGPSQSMLSRLAAAAHLVRLRTFAHHLRLGVVSPAPDLMTSTSALVTYLAPSALASEIHFVSRHLWGSQWSLANTRP